MLRASLGKRAMAPCLRWGEQKEASLTLQQQGLRGGYRLGRPFSGCIVTSCSDFPELAAAHHVLSCHLLQLLILPKYFSESIL